MMPVMPPNLRHIPVIGRDPGGQRRDGRGLRSAENGRDGESRNRRSQTQFVSLQFSSCELSFPKRTTPQHHGGSATLK